MTNTMTMQEQIKMSGLEITTSSQLQWNPTNQWSPLLGGGRQGQACVTIVSDSGENDAAAQTIVVIGGEILQIGEYTNSVIVWDPSTMEWRNGPNLNETRSDLVAVVCRGKVYAIGGFHFNNNNHYHYYTTLDTIESIPVSSLLETMETSTTTRQNNSQWTRLQCHLSSPRKKCAVAVVHNRYVVILGGLNGIQDLSSVDIMDTAPHHNNNNGEPTIVAGPHHNNNNGEPTIVAGPSMTWSRFAFGAAVMDNCIFVVGGYVNYGRSTSVESLLFQQQPQDKDKDHTNSNSNLSCMLPNSSWRVEPHTLSTVRTSHALAKVGSCLIVAGGCTHDAIWGTTSVEVLDIQQAIVWSLPNLTIGREYGCSMVTLSDSLLVLGGNSAEDSVESLALSVYRKHERCFNFVKFLIEIEFLGGPSRKRCV